MTPLRIMPNFGTNTTTSIKREQGIPPNIINTGFLHTGATVVECSPFRQSSNLLAFGDDTHISVLIRKLKEEQESLSDQDINDNQPKGWDWTEIDFHHGTRISSLCWSPHSSSPTLANPNADIRISLCAAGADAKLRYYSKTIQSTGPRETISLYPNFMLEEPVTPSTHTKFDQQIEVILDGHNGYINDCSFSPSLEQSYLASVSDDCSAIVWDIDAEKDICRLDLKSSGVSVKWHKERPSQLMVAEEMGVIKIYDLRSKNVVFRVNTDQIPLTEADWNPFNQMIGCVSGNQWYTWMPGLYALRKNNLTSSTGYHASHFKWCRSNPRIFATTSATTAVVSIRNIENKDNPLQLDLGSSSSRMTSLSWMTDETSLVSCGGGSTHIWSIRGIVV